MYARFEADSHDSDAMPKRPSGGTVLVSCLVALPHCRSSMTLPLTIVNLQGQQCRRPIQESRTVQQFTPCNSATKTKYISLIEGQQAALGMSDTELCQAVGFDRELNLTLIKDGSMKIPLTKIPAFASALDLDAAVLLREALNETAPDLLVVIEKVFNPLRLNATEVNLITHLRGLCGDRQCSPLVLDGKGVIVLVAA